MAETKSASSSSSKPKQDPGEKAQEERLARSRANRDADIAERAEAQKAREENQLAADVANRSAAQQAVDRADDEEES